MTTWKLGCKWGSDAPSFYTFIKDKGIVIGVNGMQYQPGDLVLLADGFTGLAVAKVSGRPRPVLEQPELEADFNRLQIEYSDQLFTAPATICELPTADRIWYEFRGGICQISKPEVSTEMKVQYSKFEAMQMQNDTSKLLESKKQIVLQGPPGTGKTRLAKLVAEQLAGQTDRVQLIQFHPAYTYEDFVRGIVADTDGGVVSYRAENKVLADLARTAGADPDNRYVLIIDELNRANLPSVLGELIYALEYRGQAVDSVYGIGAEKDRKLILPKNLYIIGTMNTADRSVGHLDYAIRRRFAFVPVLPDISVVPEGPARRLFEAVQALFAPPYLSNEFLATDVQPGHSYFLTSTEEGLTLEQKLQYELKPLLLEYLKDGILLPAAREVVEGLSL